MAAAARWGAMGESALAVVVVLGWALATAARTVDWVANRAGCVAPTALAVGIPGAEVQFSATNSVRRCPPPQGARLSLNMRNSPHLLTVSQQTSRGALTPRMWKGSSGRPVVSR